MRSTAKAYDELRAFCAESRIIDCHDHSGECGPKYTDPIIAMSFLQLPVIPELKITDKSLVEMTAKGPRKVSLLVD